VLPQTLWPQWEGMGKIGERKGRVRSRNITLKATILCEKKKSKEEIANYSDC